PARGRAGAEACALRAADPQALREEGRFPRAMRDHAGPSAAPRAAGDEGNDGASATPAAAPSETTSGDGPRPDGRQRRYMDREDRARRWKAQSLCVLTIVSGLGYLAWIVFAMNPEHPVLGVGFLLSEAACLTLFACA